VLQRNKGIENSSCDIVIFLDDDVILDPRYFEQLIDAYQAKWSENLGGVQGSIIEISEKNNWGPVQVLHKLFFLDHIGKDGILKPTGSPTFLRESKEIKKVEIFSGCMMSFRRKLLLENRFDENLKDFWIYDDIELSYRISRKYDLYQTPHARLNHKSSSFSYEGQRKIAMMSVINRLYIFKKYFNKSILNWILYLWSNLGEIVIHILVGIKHRTISPIRGFIEGWNLVLKGEVEYLKSR
jgi:GT2 family glycosyltransferase